MTLTQDDRTLSAEAGDTFGKYDLVKLLAKGGMAEIYLAEFGGMEGFKKRCVIKKILPDRAQEIEFTSMLTTEAKVSAMLNHPHIVQTFDFGKIGSEYFLAMEFVDGPTYRQFLRASINRGEPLGVRIATAVAIPILDALSYAHTFKDSGGGHLNIVHRDVTPGNILFTQSGVPKLADFGVVKVANNPINTATGVIKGKFAYVAPEQVASLPIDGRADIFSLGVVLWESVVGARLFKRSDLAAELLAISECKVPRPSRLIEGFPAGFEAILMKALAKKREKRFRSATEMMEALEDFRAKQGWGSPITDLRRLLRDEKPLEYPEATSLEPQQARDTGPQPVRQTFPPIATESIDQMRARTGEMPPTEPTYRIHAPAPIDPLVLPPAYSEAHITILVSAVCIVATAFFWFWVLS